MYNEQTNMRKLEEHKKNAQAKQRKIEIQSKGEGNPTPLAIPCAGSTSRLSLIFVSYTSIMYQYILEGVILFKCPFESTEKWICIVVHIILQA